MAIKILLKNDINNDSLQIGDMAYYVPAPTTSGGLTSSLDEPLPIGIIDSISGNSITISGTPVNQPSQNDFIMFSKDYSSNALINTTVNTTSLLGYYAEVKLKNNSGEKAELFALSSEVTASSK